MDTTLGTLAGESIGGSLNGIGFIVAISRKKCTFANRKWFWIRVSGEVHDFYQIAQMITNAVNIHTVDISMKAVEYYIPK